MKVLITGGTGFIGTNLALHYARQGWDVTVLSQEATPVERENAADLRQAGVETVKGSVTDEAVLEPLVAGTDLVFHIAAAMREANIPDQVFWDVNVNATGKLLELARQAQVGRFVYCSSIGAMGKSLQKPANEETPCQPEDIYQVTKKAAEELCLDFHHKHNFPLVIVRPADVYGPRDRRLLKLFKGVKKGRFVLIGSGKNEHHMVHVNDMVQAFVRAAEVEAAIGKTFIIADDCPVTVTELLQIVAEETGGSFPKIKVPLAPVQAAAVVVEAACKPFGIQPPLYPRRVDFFRSDYAFDISLAKKVLGYQPQYDLRRGLRNTLHWYQQRGLVGGGGHSQPLEPELQPGEASVPGSLGSYQATGPAASHTVEDAFHLASQIERFDSFWEGPEEVEKGYASFGRFYRANYMKHVPADRNARTLVVSCGPGYFVNVLKEEGYTQVMGIDSDPGKVAHAARRGLNCQTAHAFQFLTDSPQTYDFIFCEQEINHLTKDEIKAFLQLCHARLRPGGTLIVHSLNGANPLTGAEALAQNFDHHNTFTDYSLQQVLVFSGFEGFQAIPLKLYVFYNNPFNYVGMAITWTLETLFKIGFMLYGKKNRIFSKKLGARVIKK